MWEIFIENYEEVAENIAEERVVSSRDIDKHI